MGSMRKETASKEHAKPGGRAWNQKRVCFWNVISSISSDTTHSHIYYDTQRAQANWIYTLNNNTKIKWNKCARLKLWSLDAI